MKFIFEEFVYFVYVFACCRSFFPTFSTNKKSVVSITVCMINIVNLYFIKVTKGC